MCLGQTTPDQNKPGEVTSALKPEGVNEMPGPGVGAQIKGLSSEPASARGAGESPGLWVLGSGSAAAASPGPGAWPQAVNAAAGRVQTARLGVLCRSCTLLRPAAVVGKSRSSQTGFVNDAISSCVTSSPTAGSGAPGAVSWWSWSHARALPARCKRRLWRLRA